MFQNNCDFGLERCGFYRFRLNRLFFFFFFFILFLQELQSNHKIFAIIARI